MDTEERSAYGGSLVDGIHRQEVLEDLVERILRILQFSEDEHFQDTPRRVVQTLLEFTRGPNPLSVLKNGFSSEDRGTTDGMVVQQHIPLRLLCPHHLLPVLGEAAVGYVPRSRIVGLSKLARLVDACGTRGPITQEEHATKVADTLYAGIEAKGVIVVTRAIHTCMAVRGVRTQDTETTVSVIRGVFHDVEAARMEFLALIRS